LFASSVTVSTPLRGPVDPGVNVTEIEHFDFAGNCALHVELLTAKSVGSAPPNPIDAILRATV
jgi:hypothetical protein